MIQAPEQVAYEDRQHVLGVVLVVTLWLPIVLWLGHLASSAALVNYIGRHRSRWWIWWLDTGFCAAGTIACMIVATII
ncbi:MAG TPA: hypothetical protein VFR41_02000, partial [Acidimicrobiia bacterium]|nr:hypothetical protein [Acidimicrobiia bacterium]